MLVDSDMRRPPNLMTAMTATEPVRAPVAPGQPSDYLDLYGLSKPPFGGPSDTSGYILFGSHRRAFELLIDHMMNGHGVVVLAGEGGVGKTETLRSAAAVAAESGLRTIMISRPPGGRISIEQLVASLDGEPENLHRPPRKALLVDDFELLPDDCVSLLRFLARENPDDPYSAAIVLSGSAPELARPEVTELMGLARHTIRLLRLSPAEVRQYIERSLWVAGGTTRRLITPEAIKLITARSDGLPGTVNRVMEAALTAGFARGDVMITAKTVDSVIGPPPPRPRPRSDRRGTADVKDRVLQIVGVGLLVTGASVFLYRGLTGLPEKGPPPIQPQPASIAHTEAQQPPPTKATETLPPALMAVLMKRGNEALDLGDIASARLLFQRAAEGGNAAAAVAMGKTYDRNFTLTANAQDSARALEWYVKAVALGDPNAGDLLRRLVAH
jgi:type II secretory pathway predicted ATPase ExeA